jgi:hypothetical protein
MRELLEISIEAEIMPHHSLGSTPEREFVDNEILWRL